MSVTFSVYVQPTKWAISCSCGDANSVSSYDSYNDAIDAYGIGVKPLCGDALCAGYNAFVIGVSNADAAPEVNVSSVNAAHLITLLGYDYEDGTGVADAQDFLGRVLIAQAVSPTDAGIPATQSGIVVEMGRSIGYSDERLTQLEEVANFGYKNNLPISWS